MSRNILILLLVTILFGSCKKNEVKLTFQLNGGVTMPCRILYYASDKKKGFIRETMADIRGGAAEIVLPERNPSLFYLFEPSKQFPAAIFYAERGDELTVTGTGDNIAEWRISGNKVSEELSEWRIKNTAVLKKNDPTEINAAVKEYVEKHTDSMAALIILYFYYNRRDNETEFFNLQSKFNKKVLDNEEFMNALSTPDIMTGLVDKPRIPAQLVMRGKSGGLDTVRLTSGKGTLLVFKGNVSGVNEITESSLKSLSEKTEGKTIAEIWADTDSLAWRRHVETDTVTTIKRLWMPLGVVDNTALSLGIRRIPYYIVVDPKGNEIYRGDSSSEAVKQFENIK